MTTVLALLTPDGPALVDPDVPVLRADDLGVVRGESVFETMRVVGRRAGFVDAHLARLRRSAARLAVDLPVGHEGLVDCAVGAWGEEDGVLRVVVTKGGTAYALVTPVPAATVAGRAGVSAVTLTLGVPAGLRADAPWLLGGVKATSYAANMAALREAEARGAQEVVYVSTDGEVLEGPTSTCAWVTGGLLVTPPADEVGILPGTTMAVALSLAERLGIPYAVRRGSVDELRAADEVLLLGSVRGVAPVLSLDGAPFPAGPVTRALAEAFEAALRA